MPIIISPFSQKLKNNKQNPKNYPIENWRTLVNYLDYNGYEVIQIGVHGEQQIAADFRCSLKFPQLVELIKEAELFISVDNFFPHMAHHYGKHGIVLFSRSDPKLWGYEQNTNLLKNPKYLRSDQFGLWESCDYIAEAFVEPEAIYPYIK